MPTIFLYDATERLAVSPRALVRSAAAKVHDVKIGDVIQEALDRHSPALLRPALARLACEDHRGSTVLCTRLEGLGHDAVDFTNTVDQMRRSGIRLICLEIDSQLDLTNYEGVPVMKAIAAYAKVLTAARGSLVRRGQAKALARGQTLGRNVELGEQSRKRLIKLLNAGTSATDAARAVGVDRFTVYRLAKRDGIPLRSRTASSSLATPTKG